MIFTSAYAEVSLNPVFSDHMVLQRDKQVTVWGTAEPGEAVSLKFQTQKKSATADAQGRWSVKLEPLKAGGPHTLAVSGKKNSLTIADIMIGEVWVCSGQSNMEWPLSKSSGYEEEIKSTKQVAIRQFLAPRKVAQVEEPAVHSKWVVCNPDTAGSFTAVGYHMARKLNEELKVPVGLLHSSWGGTRIEPWIPKEGFQLVSDLHLPAPKKGSKFNEGSPSSLYNGMISGYVGYAIRGAIWYQGESNHGEPPQSYVQKMQALVGGWRQAWNAGDFPFYYVQIAPFKYKKEDPHVLPVFWEAQAACLKIKNTGMVVTMDIGNPDDIHPVNKRDVGLRLANLALTEIHGIKSIAYKSPAPTEFKFVGSKVQIRFEQAGEGLTVNDGQPFRDFEISADGKHFVPATVRLLGREQLELTAKEVPAPTSMRFAWHKVCKPNLVNSEGLPCGAFRASKK